MPIVSKPEGRVKPVYRLPIPAQPGRAPYADRYLTDAYRDLTGKPDKVSRHDTTFWFESPDVRLVPVPPPTRAERLTAIAEVKAYQDSWKFPPGTRRVNSDDFMPTRFYPESQPGCHFPGERPDGLESLLSGLLVKGDD